MYKNLDLILRESHRIVLGRGETLKFCFQELILAARWRTNWKEENKGTVGREGFAFCFLSQMVVAWIRKVAIGMERRQWIHEVHRR